jgi:hypothetical protein
VTIEEYEDMSIGERSKEVSTNRPNKNILNK